jgi:murein DD-endopeptidase MepM/ murein hydrolase activator NlpD
MPRRAVLTLVVCCLMLAVAPASVGAQSEDGRPEKPLTALEVRGIAPPHVVKGTDGRRHVEYDLAITNTFTANVTLTSLEVRDPRGGRLLRLEGDALAAVTTEFLGATPTATVEPSQTVQTVIDVALPRGVEVPARLAHRVDYEFPPDALFYQLIGSRQVDGPVLRVERGKPIVVSPPLRGSGWIATNACCEPSSHRSFVLAANGSFVTPEVFAIDFIREVGGRVGEGDGSQNSQWFGHGQPVVAAAGGRVVSARNDMPEVPPGTTISENPTLRSVNDLGGNHVLIRMRRGVYALYGHLVPGSVRVNEGDQVETGEQLGLLGNTGNTSAPHLHFGLIDGRGLLSSDSLPFVIDRFTYGGQAELSANFPDVDITGTPRPVRKAHPLANSIANFSP